MVKIIFRAGALFFTGKENGASAAGKLSPKERERPQNLCGIAKTHLHKSKRKDAPRDASLPTRRAK